MKKLICVVISCVMILSCFAGCGKEQSTTPTGYEKNFKVAVVQQVEHSSLDEISAAVISELKAQAEAKGVGMVVEKFNGQGDQTALNQIGAQAVSDGYDAIVPVATLAAQCMVTAAEGTNIPILYAAVSDPEAAGLTGISTVSGVSDALNTPFILDMMLSVQPEVKTVGLLYSSSEPNSAAPIAEAKAYLDGKGIAYLEKTGNSTDEIVNAANAMVGRVDAVFTPTDNVVMTAEAAVAEILGESGIPHYTGADSFVQAGAFTTCGVNYTELGQKVAQMAMDVLTGGSVPTDFVVMDGGIITVNTDTAQKVGVDFAPFADMANTVVEVQ